MHALSGFFVEAADKFLTAARSGDLEGVRKACRFFFDSTASSLFTLIEKMEARAYPEKVKVGGFQAIEPHISGMPTYAGSARATIPMLRPVTEIDRMTYAL